jgi:hypothetical protein
MARRLDSSRASQPAVDVGAERRNGDDREPAGYVVVVARS